MDLQTSLKNLHSNTSSLTSAILFDIEDIAFKSVQIRGEFPTSLQLIKDIKKIIKKSKTKADLIIEELKADPLLSLRILSIANFEYYGGNRKATTISEAIKNIGTDKLKDVVSNVAETKEFNSIYLGRGISLTVMQQSLIAGIIASRIVARLSNKSELVEKTYLTSVLTNLPLITIAYYFPNIYCGLLLDSMDNRELLEDLFYDNLGKSIYDISVGFANSLSLPEEYKNYCMLSAIRPWDKTQKEFDPESEPDIVATSVSIANYFAHEICHFTGVQGAQSLIYKVDKTKKVPTDILESILGVLGDSYMERTARLHLNPVRIPEYLLWFTADDDLSGEVSWKLKLPSITERINPFLYELRACLKTRTEPGQFPRLPQAVLCTLNALIKGLNFDRAIFMVFNENRKTLKVIPSIGAKLLDPQKIKVNVEEDSQKLVTIRAFNQQKAVFTGLPQLEDGHPFVAFPIATGGSVRGVFYADKLRRPDSDALSSSEQISCIAIAEEWHDFPEGFY